MRPEMDIQVDHRITGRTETTGISPGAAADAASYFERCRSWHEASHAVVGLHLGLRLRYVTINRAEATEATGDPTVAGFAKFEDFQGERGSLAAVAFAGIASDSTFGFPGAELEGDPTAATAAAACFSSHDFEVFRRLLPDPTAQRAACLLAHKVLSEHRGEVVAIGQALAERGRLTGDEVAALLRL
jgi:hypothetical protein